MHYFRKLYIVLFLFLIMNTTVYAMAQKAELVLDNTEITLSGSIRMDIVFSEAEGMPEPEIPDIDGLRISHLRSTDVISRDAGRVLHGKRHTYLIMPEKPGDFEIGPFDFYYNNTAYRTEKVEISVVSGLSKSSDSAVESVKEEEFRVQENAFLIIAATKEEVYVNEQFQIAVALYYRDLQLTDIEYPTLEHEGFSMGEFNPPQASRKNIKNYDYRIVTFRNSIFAVRPGELQLGPARISCSSFIANPRQLTGIADEGSQKKSLFNLESIAKDITVLPLPQDQRPKNFKGAVGDFSLKLDIEPEGYIEVGEAIVLTMEISGKGNLYMIQAPVVEENEDFIFYDSIVENESKHNKIFKQTIVPKTAFVSEIPAVEFSFFRPESKEYITLRQGPTEIKVFDTIKEKASALIDAPDKSIVEKPEQEPIGEGIIYIKERPGLFRKKGAYLYKDKRFIMSQAIPAVLYFLTVVFYRRHKRFKEDIGYARSRIALKQARKGLRHAQALLDADDKEGFYSSVFSCIQEYLGNKFNLPPNGITQDIADKILKSRGVDNPVIENVTRFFSECYLARYTPGNYEKKHMSNTLAQAKKIIEYFKRI
jgi:hypothetical protein